MLPRRFSIFVAQLGLTLALTAATPVSLGTGQPVPSVEELRNDLARLAAASTAARSELQAETHCDGAWRDVDMAIGQLERSLASKVRKKERPAVKRDLDAARRYLDEAKEACENRLRERYQTTLQRWRDHMLAIEALLAAGTVPINRRDSLAVLLENTENAYRGMTHGANDGHGLRQLEEQLASLETRLAALDPCQEWLERALSRLAGSAAVESFDELCRVASASCLFAPHAATAQRELQLLLDRLIDTGGDPGEPLDEELRGLLELPREQLDSCLPGSSARLRQLLEQNRDATAGDARRR